MVQSRQIDEKYGKMFVTAHVVLCTATMFLASALNRMATTVILGEILLSGH